MICWYPCLFVGSLVQQCVSGMVEAVEFSAAVPSCLEARAIG